MAHSEVANATTIKSGWWGGLQIFWDAVTHETVHVNAPVWFANDFQGIIGGDPMDGTITWSVVEVLLNTAIAPVADQSSGVIGLLIDADNNAEDAVLYFGDERPFDVGAGINIEFRLAMHVIPTGGAPATGVSVVFGLANDHNLDKDTVAAHAWFRLQGAASLLTETNDTTNDNDDVDTLIDLVVDEYHIFRIDCTDLADVRFYVDGAHVNTATTFDMSNLTAAEEMMQPYISLDKAANVTVAEMYLDYVKVWGNR